MEGASINTWGKIKMFIDKNFNKIDIDAMRQLIDSGSAYIWGDSLHNSNIFDVFSPSSFKGIFDNDSSKWGKERNSLKIQGFSYQENLIIISAIEDIFSLIPQLQKLDIKDYYFYRSKELHNRYEKPELSFYKKSSGGFLGGSNFKYLHVIPDQKFIVPLLDVIEKGFNIKNHAFLIYALNRDNPCDIYNIWNIYLQLEMDIDNVLIYDGVFLCDEFAKKRRINIDKAIKQCERLIFHGEIFSASIGNVFCDHVMEVKKKGIFIPWSGDFDKNSFFLPYIDKILRHCPIVVLGNVCSNRLNEMLQNCRFSNLHRFSEPISYVQAIDKPVKERSLRPKVFIAHSCDTYNKVVESMQYLKKFKGHIDVYCVGSYGNFKYADEVRLYGKSIFGNDFHMLTDFMPYKKYVEFLSSIDVTVMAMEVGAGMTTIHILCYVGSKLYFKRNTNTAMYVEARGYKWHDIDDIEYESLDEFCCNIHKEDNYECVKFEFDLNDKISKWHKLLEMKI